MTSTTTTKIEITTTSPDLTTFSTTPETAVTDDEIRVCSCEEAKECDEKAYKKVDECKESCKSNLEYFGTSVDKYLTCFNDAIEESKKMTKCLQSNVNNFCVENPKESAFIPKQDYSIYYESYGVKEDTLEKTPELQKKAREIFIQQRKFQTCVIECLKKESVKCYENIGCAIGFPGKKDTDEILDSCPLFKSDLHMNALKQCQCLAFKKDVKKLYGKCAYVVSPYFMRKL
uniref:Uncharacterized protein n=1 Tax=Panagrolaimus sp. ES5 TaxID=591445 RepID=A0AC34FYD3_9BILA